MALPDFDELKNYLKVTTDIEDDLIDQINESSQAWVRSYYQVPLSTASRTFTGLWPRVGAQHRSDTRLVVPVRPCDAAAVVTDGDGTMVDATTYTIDQRTAYVEAKRGYAFSNPPYQIAIDVGWRKHPDYTADIEPILRQAILWAASTYYRNRNVAAIYEQSGGQVSITYTEQEIPPLLKALMRGLRDTVWFAV